MTYIEPTMCDESLRLLIESMRHSDKGLDFRGIDLSACFLGGIDLRGADFRGAGLAKANFAKADLRGAQFSGATGAHFLLADLRGASFRHAKLYKADLTEADLRGADFTDAVLAESSLYHANCAKTRFKRAQLEEVYANNADFTGCSFEGARFIDVDLVDAKITQRALRGVRFGMDRTVHSRGSRRRDLWMSYAGFTSRKGLPTWPPRVAAITVPTMELVGDA